MIALLTLTALELALQLAFPRLPMSIIEQMPQYRQRLGFQLNAEHGLQEYPARETVDYLISRTSGDLYKLTCLSPDDAPPFASYRVSFQRDAHGFRNPEPWPDKVDLVVVGDSFTAAEAIDKPFWSGLSDSMLVLGLPGSGTLPQQRLLEAYALPRAPRIVVLAFFAGNDLQDNLTFYRKLRAEGRALNAAQGGKSPLDYSVLFHILYAARNALAQLERTSCHFPQLASTEPPAPLAFYEEFLTIFALDQQSLQASEMYRLTRDAIGEIAFTLDQSGASLILMYIPQKAEIYWDLLSNDSKSAILAGSDRLDADMPVRAISENVPALRELMAALAAELGIGFLDMTRPLSQALSEGEQPYFFADTHWNQTGHNLARIALLDFLIQSNLEL